MKTRTNKNEQLFMTIHVTADLRNKKLLVPKETAKNLHNLTCDSTEMYFKYKNMYPDYEEVIVPDIKPIPIQSLKFKIA